MNQSEEWIKLYAAAMLESDLAQLPQRIERPGAIRARLELSHTPAAELRELKSALNYLQRLTV